MLFHCAINIVKHSSFIYVFCIVILFANHSFAETYLDESIRNQTFVQRGSLWAVSGTTDSKNKFFAKFLNQELETTPKDGKWSVIFEVPAGYHGQAELVVDNKPLLKDITVGDIWLCSGQSNMILPALRAADHSQIRDSLARKPISILQIPNQTDALRNGTLPWQPADSDKSQWFSAVCLAFGAALYDQTRIPVGLINASAGGTRIESWLSQNAVKEVPCAGINERSRLFDLMIAPLSDQPIKGVLWYQGESNRDDPLCYSKLLRTLIQDWRTHWKDPKLPFVIMQLPGYGPQGTLDVNSSWAALRNSQLGVVSTSEQAALAVTVDLGDGSIHPPRKTPFGERAASAAHALAYEQKKYPAILPTGFHIDGAVVRVEFNDGQACLKATRELSELVYVAGEDRRWHPAEVEVRRSSMTARSADVPKARAIRYAWSDNPKIGLLSCEDATPVTPFRSDDWPPVPKAADLD